MCLYPKLIINKKYTATKKNSGNIPIMKDERTKYVPIGCGKCMECLRKKSRNWQVRLHEEIKTDTSGLFVTLSYSNESLKELEKKVLNNHYKTINEIRENTNKYIEWELDGYDLDNAIAKWSIRKFLERWRKKYKTSVKHWLVSELGQKNTERLHIHGLLFTTETKETIEKIWKYGNIWIGDYVNGKTINYIVKYINKQDSLHKHYIPVVLCSPGIGNNYIKSKTVKINRFQGKDTKEYYITNNNIKLPLPIYYRNHIYTDDQKEDLWINILDKEERWINGIKVDVSKNEDDYNKLLKYHRAMNRRLGYPEDENHNEKEYERQRRNLKKLQTKK